MGDPSAPPQSDKNAQPAKKNEAWLVFGIIVIAHAHDGMLDHV